MRKNTRTYLIAGLAALAAVAGGVALLNSDKTSAQKQSADTTGNGLIGKPLPNIQLADKDGRTFSLESLKGKNAVLFFNEGLMCYPACWNQMVAFGTDPRFNSAGTVAISGSKAVRHNNMTRLRWRAEWRSSSRRASRVG